MTSPTQRSPLKYGNKRTHGYSSRHEANVAANLHVLADRKIILDLKEQVSFQLIPKEIEGGLKYVADFVFTENGKQVVMDAKGCRTEVFRIKRKLMKWLLNIDVQEV